MVLSDDIEKINLFIIKNNITNYDIRFFDQLYDNNFNPLVLLRYENIPIDVKKTILEKYSSLLDDYFIDFMIVENIGNSILTRHYEKIIEYNNLLSTNIIYKTEQNLLKDTMLDIILKYEKENMIDYDEEENAIDLLEEKNMIDLLKEKSPYTYENILIIKKISVIGLINIMRYTNNNKYKLDGLFYYILFDKLINTRNSECDTLLDYLCIFFQNAMLNLDWYIIKKMFGMLYGNPDNKNNYYILKEGQNIIPYFKYFSQLENITDDNDFIDLKKVIKSFVRSNMYSSCLENIFNNINYKPNINVLRKACNYDHYGVIKLCCEKYKLVPTLECLDGFNKHDDNPIKKYIEIHNNNYVIYDMDNSELNAIETECMKRNLTEQRLKLLIKLGTIFSYKCMYNFVKYNCNKRNIKYFFDSVSPDYRILMLYYNTKKNRSAGYILRRIKQYCIKMNTNKILTMKDEQPISKPVSEFPIIEIKNINYLNNIKLKKINTIDYISIRKHLIKYMIKNNLMINNYIIVNEKLSKVLEIEKDKVINILYLDDIV